MIDLIRAEWLKIIRNLNTTTALIWIFPIGAATVLLIGIVMNLAAGDFGGYMGQSSWNSSFVAIWAAINSYPLNVFGRMLPLAFMAVVFAGEFQWETWRLIVPKASRVRLVIAKWAALIMTILVAFTLTGLIIVFLQGGAHAVIGKPYGPVVTLSTLTDALQVSAQEVLIATLSLLLLGTFAALAAFITRSVLGALLLTFGFSLVELLSSGLLAVLATWFDRPAILEFYRYMPNFNLENLRSWMIFGHGLSPVPFNLAIEASVFESVLFVGIWILLLGGWAISLFNRMDITK